MPNAIDTLREAQEELHTRMFHDPTWPAVSENLDAALADVEALLQAAEEASGYAQRLELLGFSWLAAAVRRVKGDT